MKFSKKITAIFIAVMMVVSAIPFTAFAAPPGSSEIGTGTGGISIGGGSTVVGGDSYLTFTGTDSFSITTNNSAKNWNGTLEYSTDKNTWTTWNGASQISSDNNVLYLRGTGNTIITGSNSSKYWVITTQGTVACSGDIRTLLDYTEPDSSSMGNYCFSNLFYNCTSLTAAPELPATILAEHCYSYMFNGCTSLTMAPELPATMLAYACYYNMFNGCTSLTTAPELPSTSLAQFCYANMFNGCTSLTTAPELPATSLAPSCYNSMFQGCTSLTTAPELWATTLTYACYYNMFNGCANLTTAPELPANDLAGRCYYNMFRDCTSLTTPSELWATDLTEGCYYGMFQGCTGIKLSTEQTAEYSAPYSIPKEETAESVGYDALTNMFTGTGGTFTGTPTINTTYYIPGPAPVGVAEVNGVGYETLEEAIAAADEGDTITLLDDITGNFTIPAGLDVSLDLNDHTITTSSTSTPVITNRGTLNVYGGTLVNNGLYFPEFLGDGGVAVMNYGVATVNVTTNKGAIVNRSTSSTTPNLTVEGGTYTGNPLALSSENNSYTVINGGNFTGGSSFVRANSGATTEVNDGNFACLGTESESNWIVNGGNVNAITVDGGSNDISITVNGGEIKELPSTSTVNNSTNVSVEVSGGSFNSVVPEEYCAEGYVPVTEPNEQGKYIVEPFKANNGANLTLLGDIEEAIYLDADAYNLGSDAVVKVTANANSNISETPDVQTKTYAVSSLTPFVDPEGTYTGTYKFAVKNAPAQITEKVTVALYASADAQEPVETIEYSVKDYCDTVIEKSNNAKLVALCKSILDYGAAAQAEFNYNTDNMAVDEFYNADAIAALTYSDITGTYLSSDLAISGCAFQCLANTNINLYIDAPLDSKNIQATIEGDEDSAIAANYMRSNKNGRLFISVNGIEAGNMTKNFTVLTSNGAITTNLNTIVKTCLYYNASTTLAKTIYFYANAADAYFN